MVVVIGGANVDVKARTAAAAGAAHQQPRHRGPARRAGSAATSPRTWPGSARGSRWSSAVGADPDGDWLLRRDRSGRRRRVAGAARRADRAATSRCSTPAASWSPAVADMAATDAIVRRRARPRPDPLRGPRGRSTATCRHATVDAVLDAAACACVHRPGQRGQGRADLPTAERGSGPSSRSRPTQAELACRSAPVARRCTTRGVEVVWVRRGAAGSLLSRPTASSTLAASGRRRRWT